MTAYDTNSIVTEEKAKNVISRVSEFKVKSKFYTYGKYVIVYKK